MIIMTPLPSKLMDRSRFASHGAHGHAVTHPNGLELEHEFSYANGKGQCPNAQFPHIIKRTSHHIPILM
jgi:hypothetical protein